VPAGAVRVDLDPSGRVSAVPDGGVLGVPADALAGRHHGEVRAAVDAHLGGVASVDHRVVGDRVELSTVHLHDGRRLRVAATPAPPDEGPGTVLWFSWVDEGAEP